MLRKIGRFAAVLLVAAAFGIGTLVPVATSQWSLITTNTINAADTSRPIVVDGGTTQGVQIGSVASGYGIKGIQKYIVQFTPASVATIVCAVQSVTVTGVLPGDIIIGVDITPTGNSTGAGNFKVLSANTVSVTYCNPTAGALTPAAGPYVFTVLR